MRCHEVDYSFVGDDMLMGLAEDSYMPKAGNATGQVERNGACNFYRTRE